MTGPFDVPSRVVSGALDGLGSLSDAARRIPEFQRELVDLLRGLDHRIETMPVELEATMRPHFEAQREAIESLRPELVRNAESAETLPPKIDTLHEAIEGLRSETAAIRKEVAVARKEVASVRAAVEPLREPAERVARISDRLPGSSN